MVTSRSVSSRAGVDPHISTSGMLAVSFRVVSHGVWSDLGCVGNNAILTHGKALPFVTSLNHMFLVCLNSIGPTSP